LIKVYENFDSTRYMTMLHDGFYFQKIQNKTAKQIA